MSTGEITDYSCTPTNYFKVFARKSEFLENVYPNPYVIPYGFRFFVDFKFRTDNAVVQGGKIEIDVPATNKFNIGEKGVYTQCYVAAGLQAVGETVKC